MPTLIAQHTFEGGSQGTRLSAANTGGSGDTAISSIAGPGAAGSGNDITFDNGSAVSGVYGAKVDQVSGAGPILALLYNAATLGLGAPVSEFNWEGFVNPANLPASGTTTLLITYSDANNTTPAGVLKVTSAGLLTWSDTGGKTVTSDAAIPTNAWTRVQLKSIAGTSLRMAVFNGQGTAALFDVTVTGTTIGSIQSYRYGILTNSSTIGTLRFDDIRSSSGAGFLGPTAAAPNVAPNVSASVDNNVPAAGAQATFTAAAGDSDGTVAALTANFTAWPAGVAKPTLSGNPTGIGSASAGLQQTATLPAPGNYTWTVTATDNSGATSTATATAFVHAADGVEATPQSVTLNTWTNVGGPNATASVSDTDAATYVRTPDGPTVGQTCRFGLGNLGLGPIKVKIDCAPSPSNAALTVTAVTRKANGTQIDSVTFPAPAASFTWNGGDPNNVATTLTDRIGVLLDLSAA